MRVSRSGERGRDGRRRSRMERKLPETCCWDQQKREPGEIAWGWGRGGDNFGEIDRGFGGDLAGRLHSDQGSKSFCKCQGPG